MYSLWLYMQHEVSMLQYKIKKTQEPITVYVECSTMQPKSKLMPRSTSEVLHAFVLISTTGQMDLELWLHLLYKHTHIHLNTCSIFACAMYSYTSGIATLA